MFRFHFFSFFEAYKFLFYFGLYFLLLLYISLLFSLIFFTLFFYCFLCFLLTSFISGIGFDFYSFCCCAFRFPLLSYFCNLIFLRFLVSFPYFSAKVKIIYVFFMSLCCASCIGRVVFLCRGGRQARVGHSDRDRDRHGKTT